ncbi:MAG TPA: DUF2062 domain-containing protein [Sphingomicrobium sp.]|nr:DUF2062 domain-containing protein [Sphingomicrobium sp.]
MRPAPEWIRRHVPTRETIHENRLLRPFARHLGQPALWRFHRRSVPRGVAIGLGVGIIIPFMHTFLAALLAIPLRANVAISAAFTLLINPLTIPPLYYFAYRTGIWELHADAAVTNAAAAEHFSSELGRILFWVHEASGPIALGIVTISIAAAVLGYSLTAIGWRIWLHAKFRRRALGRPRASRR